MKLANAEFAFQQLKCFGPGWTVMTFENPKKNSMTLRLSHVHGFTEEMDLTHEELYDNPVGAMDMVRQWVESRTMPKPVPVIEIESGYTGTKAELDKLVASLASDKPYVLVPEGVKVKILNPAGPGAALAADIQASIAAVVKSRKVAAAVQPILPDGRTRLIELE